MKLEKYKELKISNIFSIFFWIHTRNTSVRITDNSFKTSDYCSGKEFYYVGGEYSLYIGFTAILL